MSAKKVSITSEIADAYHKAADEHPGPAFTREELARIVGVSPRYIANLDCHKKIPGSFHSGRRAMYLKGPAIEWAISRVSSGKGGLR